MLLNFIDDSYFHIVFISLFSFIVIAFYAREKIFYFISNRLDVSRQEVLNLSMADKRLGITESKLYKWFRATSFILYICCITMVLFIIYTAIYWNEKIGILTGG
ncbi:hypothetical protein M2404_003765 [Rheinheimera pacifica]|nr:hypothetical protein [Rheinheimera pacifica]